MHVLSSAFMEQKTLWLHIEEKKQLFAALGNKAALIIVRPDDVDGIVLSMQNMGWGGFNEIIPHDSGHDFVFSRTESVAAGFCSY